MKLPITSRPATAEERMRITDFLQRDYFQSIHQRGVNDIDWMTLYHNDDAQERQVERDFSYIASIVKESDVQTFPGFFPDGDLIELRVWPLDFLNTFQHFKHFPDGRLIRSPHHTDRTHQAVREKIAAATTDWWWTCGCGNDPAEKGFSGCDEQGKPTADHGTSEWCVCEQCGRVFHSRTLIVCGRRRYPIQEPAAGLAA